MYVWIWRHLPGNLSVRLLQVLVIIVIICALLLFIAFPWIEPKLWFTHVTVQQ
jgi:hypothetical protein